MRTRARSYVLIIQYRNGLIIVRWFITCFVNFLCYLWWLNSHIQSGLLPVSTSTTRCGQQKQTRTPCMTRVKLTVCPTSLAGGWLVYWNTPRRWWLSAVPQSTATDGSADALHRPWLTGPSTTETPQFVSKTTDRKYTTACFLARRMTPLLLSYFCYSVCPSADVIQTCRPSHNWSDWSTDDARFLCCRPGCVTVLYCFACEFGFDTIYTQKI